MKKARIASARSGGKARTGKAVADSQPAVTAMATQAGIVETIGGCRFLAAGVSDKRGKFLLVAKGGQYAVLSVRGLSRSPAAELERLETLDVHLLVPADRNAFLKDAQKAANMTPTFKVATQIGWFDDVFALPKSVFPPQPQIVGMPKGMSKLLVYLDAKDDDIHSRFRCNGSPEKSQEIFRLCRGNSRLIFAAALSFVGPCCKPFKLRAPGVQFVGAGGSAKTVLGVVAGASWGGVPGSTLGFGSAWNGTPNGLEDYAPAHKDALMVLDETGLMPSDQKGHPLAFGEALMRLAQGQGKKRYGVGIDRWSVPLISTSNRSVYALLDPKRREHYEAYTDRLIDIPTPNHGDSFFEDLHGHKDPDAFGQYLFDLATENFGYPGRAFLKRLTAALKENRAGLTAEVAANVTKYKAAADVITSTRKVLRVRGYFAAVYATGCLAKRFKILPITEPELLAAVLSCHRDHVAFVDQDVAGGPPWVVEMTEGRERGEVQPAHQPVADAEKPAEQRFNRLRHFINANRKGGFLDLETVSAGDSFTPSDLGYVHWHGRGKNRYKEYLLADATFEEIAGGPEEAETLKSELYDRGLIVTDRRGDGVSYVVKRSLPDGSRPYFVVVRAEEKQ